MSPDVNMSCKRRFGDSIALLIPQKVHASRAPIAAILGAATLASVVFSAPAIAGDFYHACRTADGQYSRGEDGMLREAKEDGSDQSKEIKFRKLSEIVLSHTKSYCVGTNASKGARFEMEEKEYLERIEFTGPDGQKITTWLLCLLASNGTPASATCGPAVVTSRRTLVPTYKN